MFDTAIAGSLPKPAWLAETEKLWPQWKASGADLAQAKLDATLLWIKAQEDAGLDVIGDGEQSRQHFVHGFLEQVEGIDFEHKVKMGIRNNRYDAMVPQVVGPLKLKGRVHATEARLARADERHVTANRLVGDALVDRREFGLRLGRRRFAEFDDVVVGQQISPAPFGANAFKEMTLTSQRTKRNGRLASLLS